MPFDRANPLPDAGTVGVGAYDTPDPSFLETVGAAFRQENLIGSALTNTQLGMDLASITKVDQNYNVYQDPDFATYVKEAPDQWDEVYNRTAAEAKRTQIDKERKDRATLAASGWTGVGASFVASIADPTIFIPGGALARTGKVGYNALRSAASVGAMAAVGAGIQEAGLHATQELRTPEESAIAIGGSAILGGLIGAGASRFLSTGEWGRVSKQIEADLIDEGVPDVVGMTDTIVKRMQSAGAAAVDDIKLDDLGVGGPKVAQIVARATAAARINPGVETMFSPSVKVREVYGRMVDNPVYTTMQMEGRSLGSDVENLVKQYQRGALAQWLESSRNIYREARQNGFTGTKTEFYQSVAKAGRRGDADPNGNPFITKAAQEARSMIFDPLLERAKKQGLLADDVKVTTAASYVTRMWNRQRLIGEEQRFKKIASDYLERAVQGQVETLTKAKDERVGRLNSVIADIELPADQRASLLETLPPELKSLREQNPAFVQTDEQLSGLRSQAFRAREAKDTKAVEQITAQVDAIATQAGQDYADYVTKRNLLQSRISRIRNNVVGRASQIEAMRARIGDVEAANIERLRRLHRSLSIVDEGMDRAAPEVLAEKLSKARTQFAQVLERSAKAQDRLAKVRETSPDDLPSFSGEMLARHGYVGERPKAFLDGFVGERNYPGSVFGDKNRVYLDGDGKWTRGGMDRFSVEGVSETGVKFDKALVVSPESAPSILKRMGRTSAGDYPRKETFPTIKDEQGREWSGPEWADALHNWENSLATGKELSDWAEANGYDGLVVTGWDGLAAKSADGMEGYAAFQSEMGRIGFVPEVAQDQVVAFKPTNVRLGADVDPAIKFTSAADQVGGGASASARRERAEASFDMAEARRIDEANQLSDRIGDLEKVDPEEALAELRTLVERRLIEASDVVSRENAKVIELAKRIDEANPKKVTERVTALKQKIADAERTYYDRVDIQMDGQNGYKDYVSEIVDGIFNNLTGKGGGQVPEWIVPATRGPLKERSFNIPDRLIEDFLENDMEAILRKYTRTMAAEVELNQKFGRADMKDQFKEIEFEYADLRKAAKTDAERDRLTKAEARDVKNLSAFRDMIRGTYRAADESSDWSKITRAALTWNYIRLLGGVTLASLTDASRFVAVHGVRATMREALPALVKGVKAAEISRGDAKALGAVTERVLQSRLASLADLNDPYAYGSRFERFLSNASNAFSRATGLGWWNDTLKTVASVMTQNRMMRNILEASLEGKVKRIEGGKVGTAPPKHGSTRYYYGSSDPAHDVRTQDDLWVTPDPIYARDYRKGADDNTLWYVDVPDDQRVSLGVRDGINNYNIIGKLPKEWAQKSSRLKGSTQGVEREVSTFTASYSKLDKHERAYMAYLGIDEDMAGRVAAQFKKHGLEEDGIYGANVSRWDDEAAVRAWGAALNKDVDRTIITKGVADTPLWMKTNWGKLIFQFKSFGLASNQRVLIAGLQERPHRLAEMTVMSSALGMLVGYLKYAERGDMEEANKLLQNPGLWVAEGLDRSGILSIPFEISNTAEKMGLPGIVTGAQALAGDQDQGGGASRYASRGKLGAVLGPSAGLFEDLALITQQLGEADLKKSGANAIIRQLPGATLPGLRTAIHVGVKPALQEAVK